MDATEKAIRENFPGKNNAGVRAMIREAATKGPGAVRGIASRVGLTACGRAGLEIVAATVPPLKFTEDGRPIED